MNRPSILSRVRIYDVPHPGPYKPARIMLADHDPAFVPLYIWDECGGLLAELGLTEDERLDLIQLLVAVGRSTPPVFGSKEAE